MRKCLMLSTAVLLLAYPGVARAQQTTSTTPLTGSVEAGYRTSSVDGDKARWERYRDLRNGLTSSVDLGKTTETSAFRLTAANIGYHDQQYGLDFDNFGKLKATASWNSIPLNYAYNTMTPWQNTGGNVWTLDPTTRATVQSGTVPAGFVGIGASGADYNTPSIYRALATTFAMQSRRDVLSAGAKYQLTDLVDVDLGFSSTKKSGYQPYGASFAFRNANEIPMELDNRTTDLSAKVEWAKPSTGMARLAWDGSWFKNQFQSLTWDNPFQATDFDNGKTPPAGPYDASGYNNGNGPAKGRLALPPTNSLSSFSALGMYKMPARSTVTAQVSVTTMKQNAELIPWTTNANIANEAVYALFPGLRALPRQTAEAEVRGINALLNFSTRPNQYFGFDMRYRFNDHENRSTPFVIENNVRFDAVPEAVLEETEHLNIRQNTLETGATFTGLPNSSVRLGYILDDSKRTGRAFSDMTDYTVRLSLDTYGNQYVKLRGLYEDTRRVGTGLSLEYLTEGGAQEAVRFYDEAPMTRHKGTLNLQVTPNEKMDVGFSLAAGKDVYDGADQEFGLLDNKNTSYNFSVSVYPTDKVTIGGTYGYETFKSLMRSRNANPSTGGTGYDSWFDPNRDWDLNNDETVKNIGVYVDLIKALPNTDVRLSYDRSNSDNAFIHSGPRIVELSTNHALTPGDGNPCSGGVSSCFEAMPDVTNTWQQLKVDVKHMFTPKVGVGVGFWYEKFEIVDFATTDVTPGVPRMDPLGEISTGYGNRPYKASTGLARLIYIF